MTNEDILAGAFVANLIEHDKDGSISTKSILWLMTKARDAERLLKTKFN